MAKKTKRYYMETYLGDNLYNTQIEITKKQYDSILRKSGVYCPHKVYRAIG